MGLFSSNTADESCDGGAYTHHHKGPYEPLEEVWQTRFKPKKQDDEYLYGYTEEHNYARCENCGEKVKKQNKFIEDVFHKVPKDSIPEEDYTELEVALDSVRYMASKE